MTIQQQKKEMYTIIYHCLGFVLVPSFEINIKKNKKRK